MLRSLSVSLRGASWPMGVSNWCVTNNIFFWNKFVYPLTFKHFGQLGKLVMRYNKAGLVRIFLDCDSATVWIRQHIGENTSSSRL